MAEFRLRPSFETAWEEDSPSEVLILDGNATAELATAFVETLHRYALDGEDSASMLEAVSAIADNRDGLVVSGGLIAEFAGVKIYPGCCCGLEGWIEWRDVAPGNENPPWLGHDPWPEVKVEGDQVLIRADEGSDAEEISIPYSTLREAIETAEADLAAFGVCLRKTLAAVESPYSEKAFAKITRAFSIPSTS